MKKIKDYIYNLMNKLKEEEIEEENDDFGLTIEFEITFAQIFVTILFIGIFILLYMYS